MGVLSTVVGVAALAHGVAGARLLKHKTIAGVQVHNFRSDATDWMVVFNKGTTDADIEGFCQGKCDLRGHPDAKGAAFAKIHDLAQLKQLVADHPEKIEVVEPDEIDYALGEVGAAASWGLDAVGVDQRSGSGRGVHIYVQDTGIRGSHTDFEGRVVPTIDLTSGSLVECSDNSCARDRQGHGTHCAGTAGGLTYGVASEATMHAVKTLSDQGSGARSWQISAIDWVATNGERPAVVSMSLGGPGRDPAYATAIGAATEAGVVVVVAAGNSNSDTCNFSPAYAAEAITVGATTSSNSRAYYSNYGTCNDIFAPGSAITSCSGSSDSGARTMSGTSMACPHVAGAAAVLLEANPLLSRDGVMAAMDANGKKGVISGLRPNDPDLFLWLGAPPAPTPAPVPTPAPPPGTWQVTGSGCSVDGLCIQSRNHPSFYGNNEACTIQINGAVDMTVPAFNTESYYDVLTVGGARFSGSTGPAAGRYSGEITWSSDFSYTRTGWRICRGV